MNETLHNLSLLFVEAKLSWGYASRFVPFSKSRFSYEFPPPTTLIGALASSLARICGWPENLKEELISSADLVRRFVRSAHLEVFLAASPFSDINRIYWIHRGELQSDAVALDKIYVSPTKENYPIFNIVYVIENEKGRQVLGNEYEKLLIEAGWAITRIGQKEGVTSVTNCQLYKELSTHVEGSTSYYFPADLASFSPKTYKQIRVVNWRKVPMGQYVGAEKINLVIPYSEGQLRSTPVRVTTSEDGVVLSNGNISVVTWRR